MSVLRNPFAAETCTTSCSEPLGRCPVSGRRAWCGHRAAHEEVSWLLTPCVTQCRPRAGQLLPGQRDSRPGQPSPLQGVRLWARHCLYMQRALKFSRGGHYIERTALARHGCCVFEQGFKAVSKGDEVALKEALYTKGPLAVSIDAGVCCSTEMRCPKRCGIQSCKKAYNGALSDHAFTGSSLHAGNPSFRFYSSGV